MQHDKIQIPMDLLFGGPKIVGGDVATWIKLHDEWHRELLRSLLVLQGDVPGDATEAERLVPSLVRELRFARTRIPAECRATDPDRLVAASARRCVKNAGRFVVCKPRWAMDN